MAKKKASTGSKRPIIKYDALPTIGRFHGSTALIKGVRGNVGSGKTVGCCWEIMRIAMNQEPDSSGVRYTKFAMIRSNYPQLLTTTVETWQQWFGAYTDLRRSAPIEGKLKYKLPHDGTVVDLSLLFLALDVPADADKVRSLEVTGTFINEASTVSRWVLTKCFERRGRYPPKAWGVKPTWAGVIMDTNSCDTDHWWYKASEEENNQGWEFFDQPPALLKFPETKRKSAEQALKEFFKRNPNFPIELKNKVVKDVAGNLYVGNPLTENAENLPLGFDYWLDQVPGKPLDEINVFILNQYGGVSTGKPVYPEYMESVHKAEEDLKAVKGVGISIGMDFGRKPACVITQIIPSGQKRVLEEHVTTEHGSMGIRTFSRTILVPHLLENFLPWLREGVVSSVGDPAGKGREQTDEKTCFMLLNECPITCPDGGFPDYEKNAERLHNDSYVKKLKALAEKGLVSLGDLGIQSRPARTNSFEARREAVAAYLTEYIDNDPAVLISPCCKYLIRGLSGEFAYKRVQVSVERYNVEPDKSHITSHVNDGFQYDCLESEFVTAEFSNKEKQEEEKIREEIGNVGCVAWDELKKIRAEIESGEYYEENYY